ncbi:hypothetical protein BLOT_010657, partial [Blomia tropicalis]
CLSPSTEGVSNCNWNNDEIVEVVVLNGAIKRLQSRGRKSRTTGPIPIVTYVSNVCNRNQFALKRIRDSAQNRTAAIHAKNAPTTAKPNDHDRKLCSCPGIQSRSSPRIPNTITAIVLNNAANKIYNGLFYYQYKS